MAEEQVDYDPPTDEHRAENYDALTKPVVRPTGEVAESQTVEHRAPDYDQLVADTDKIVGTVTERAETKVITPADSKAETKQ